MKKLFYLILLCTAYATGHGQQHLSLQQVNELAAKNFPLLKQTPLIEQTSMLSIQNLQRGFMDQGYQIIHFRNMRHCLHLCLI